MAASAQSLRHGALLAIGHGSGSSDALNRILGDLCTRDIPKEGASLALKKHLEEEARDLSGEGFSRFMDQLYDRISVLLESNDVAENLGALRAIDELIDVALGENASKVSKFSNYMRAVFETKRDPEILVLASRVLGHLARAGGAMTADEVERQVKVALDWLRRDRVEYRRFAAVLILKEMAENASTVFNVHVPEFVDAIWVALRDPRLDVRERAVQALRACLRVIEKRETRWRVQWYYRMFEATQDGLGKNAPVHSIHGSLLAVGELLRNSGEFMMSRYREVADIVLRYLEHRDRLVRLSITSLLPRIAHFLRDRFVTNYLTICMNHILTVLRIPAERASGFIALGEMAGALDGELVNYLPTIISHLRDAIAPRRGRPSLEALACVGNIAKAMGPAMEPHVRGLLDIMIFAGLSPTLVDALEQITISIPSLLPTIQYRLLDCISMVLSKTHYPHGRLAVGAGRGTSTNSPQQVSDFGGQALVQLALQTLARFNFKGHDLLEFARDSVVVYLDDEDRVTRKDAALCCCRLVANSFLGLACTQFGSSRSNRTGGKRQRLVEELVEKLLIAAVADADVTVRHSIFASLHGNRGFDDFLAQAGSLSAVFAALNDEDFDVREFAISLAGRLSEKNPAYVLPALRRHLIQLLTYLEQSSDSKCREESAKLLGCLIRNCERLIRPYIAPVHKALVARLVESVNANNAIISGVLVTVGDLARVGGFEMRQYIPELMPLIVDALLDGAAVTKREVAVATLGQVVQSTGYVISPYNEYPLLLGLLLKLLNGELAWSTRREVLKVLGIMGALDPHVHKRNQLSLPGSHGDVARAASDSGQHFQSMDELPADLWPSFATSEDYFSTVSINSLMRILRDPSLASYHLKVVGSLMFIFKSMGLGCVPYLQKVLPDLFHTVRTCDDALRDFITWKLGTLVSIVRQHIRKYLQELLCLIAELWSSFSFPSASRPSFGYPVLHLVEQLCLALNDEFRTYLPHVLPCCIQLLGDSERYNDYTYVLDILHTLEVFGGTLDEHMHLLLPVLIRLFKVDASVEIRRAAIKTLTKLIPRVQVTGHISSLVHHLKLVLDGKNDELRNDELRNDVVDAICCLAQSLGEDFNIFVPSIHKLMLKHRLRHKDFEEIEGRLQRREPLILGSTAVQRFSRKHPAEVISDPLNDLENDPYDVGSDRQKQLRGHQVDDGRLRAAGEASQRSTKEDWAEWMRHFSIELLKQSPSPALRTCARLAQLQPFVGRELFAAGFVSCWAQLNETSQKQLVRSMEMAFSSPNIPPEILATLLNLAEFMEHDEKPLPIDIRLLGALAEKCRAFAKALHYKEMEFEGACSKKMDANPVAVVEALIHINNQLHQHEAAVGILTFAQQHLDVQLKESWYEKLQRWDDALKAYTVKASQALNPHIVLDATLGRMRCLAALARWEELNNLCKEYWTPAEPAARLEMAPMAANAAWNMGEWDQMAEYVSRLDDGDETKLRGLGNTAISGDGSSSGTFFRAVLLVRRGKYEEAREYVERARKCLATELAALVLESYERAYSNMVRVQQLSELEEVIDYCTLPMGNPVAEGRRALIRNMWTERIKGAKRNVEVWQVILAVRALVLPPAEDTETWLKFASLCRKSGRISQARSTLIKLLQYDPETSHESLRYHGPPQVMLAYLEYQWSLGEDHKRKRDMKLRVKPKKYDSRAYRSSFKNRKTKLEAADRGEKQNRESKFKQGGSASCRGKINSIDEYNEMIVDELNEEYIREISAKKKLEYNSSRMAGLDLSLKPSCGEKDGDGVGVSRDGECANLVPSISTTKETNESERMQVDSSAAEKLKAPELTVSSFRGRTLDKEIGSLKSQNILPLKRKMTMTDIDADLSLSDAKKRVNLDPIKQGSMCNTNLNKKFSSTCRTEVSGKQGSGVTVGSDEKCDNDIQRKESTIDLQTADSQNTCFICKQGGKLLCCDGRGCDRSYHLKCIDPPMDDVPIGVWCCSRCVKKKIKFGVHSVSEGVESIWDVREVEVSDVDDGIKRKEYFVKYKGLAHIHNCWVQESKLLLEAPSLVAKFNRKNQITRLKPEWTVPHRLLQRRLLALPKQHDLYPVEHAVDNLGCHHEWLVKWHGLDYKHATWELENSSLFNSAGGQHLIYDYDNRLLKARIENKKLNRGKFSPELYQLPAGFSGSDSSILDHISKLRELWYEGKNAAIMDCKERIKKVVAFVMSLQSDVCQPFLIITTSSSLYSWYDEFLLLAPTINAVVYSGDKDSRKLIRKLEFYEESGCIMFQVLIATLETTIEDLDVLAVIGWETIVFDDFQRSRIPLRAKFKMLTTKMRLLLVSSPLKDNTADYSSSLSLLDSDDGLDRSDPSLTCSVENFNKLKERFSQYVVFGWKSDSPRFKEYWVPVELSNVQLEQYCNIMISNATLLRSSSKGDIVGALHDMLRAVRKCCDHPYVVNQKLQTKLIGGLPEVDWLDVGIKASGKLQLLDKMLLEIKRQGSKALVIFQSISGSGRDSIGDILDDVMRQRFGPNSYEHVEASVNPFKKQAALNNFNNKECDSFVFLLDARACSPGIKLYSVDTVIIYGSDWNPMNDVKQLQKIKLYSQSDQIKIFRLYSCFTVEEKVLCLAKQGKILDSNLQNVGRTTILSLLMWGASQQFEKLDKFHASNTLASCASILPVESPLQEVISGFLSILSHYGKDIDLENSSIISNLQQVGGVYSCQSLLLGETQGQLIVEEQPHVFWTKLLEGKDPQWIYASALPLGNRRRVQHSEDILKKPEAESGEIIKKHNKCINNCTKSSSHELGSDGEVSSGDKEVAASADNSPPSSPMSNVCPNEIVNASSGCTLPHLDYNFCESSVTSIFESEERRKLLDTQTSLYLHLKPEISKLCNILQLSDLVKGVTDKFLMYMVHNHHVNREPPTRLQAFEISVCWFAASLVKQKIDHKESLFLAREHLNFSCKKEEVEYEHSLLRCLKRVFLYRTGNLEAAVFPKSSSEDVMKDGLLDSLKQLVSSDRDGPSQLGSSPEFKLAAKDILKSIKEIKKKFQKQLVKLAKKQQEEKNQIVREYEEGKAQLEKRHRVDEAVARKLYPNNSSMRTDKLNVLKASLRKKLEEQQRQLDMHLEDIEVEQQAVRNEMEESEACWVEAVKSWVIVELLGKPPSNEPWQCMDYSQNKELIKGQVNAEDSEKVLTSEIREQNRTAASGDDQGNLVSENPNSQEQNPNIPMSGMMNGDVQHVEPKIITSSHAQPVGATSDKNFRLDRAYNDEHTFTSTIFGSHVGEAPASDGQNVSQEGDHIGDVAVSNDLSASQINDLAGSQPAEVLGSICTNHEAPTFEPAEQMLLSPSPISPSTCNWSDIALVDRVENEPLREDHTSNQVSKCPTTLVENSLEYMSQAVLPDVPPVDSVENEQIREDNASNLVFQVEIPLVENPLYSFNQAVLPGVPVDSIENEPSIEDSASNQVFQSGILETSLENLTPAVLPDIPSVDSTHNEARRHASDQDSQFPRPLVANSLEHSYPAVSHPLNNFTLHPSIDLPIGGLETHLGISNHPVQSVSAAVSSVPLPVNIDPLKIQLERLRRETDQLHKFHEDKRLKLISDFEKEKAELERKYELKLQEEDVKYLVMKKENDANQNVVLMNQILAEAFRSKCMDIRPSSNFELQQDANSSFMQQTAQRSTPVMGPSIALHSPAAAPNLATTSHAPPYTVAPSSVSVSGSSSLVPDTSTRPPPHIGILSSPTTNVIRARPPHLQPYRPSLPLMANHHATLPHVMPSQDVNSKLPVTSDSLPPLQTQLPSSTYLTSLLSGSHLPNSSLSAVGLHQDIFGPPFSFPSVPDLVPNVGRQNFSESISGMHTNLADAGGCNDVVCLSDDE